MRRILSFLFSAILLAGCVSTTPDPVNLPTPVAVSRPAATRTPVPVPTRIPNVGARPDALSGIEVTVWHGWDGSASSLFEQMASEFNLSNEWGLKVKVVPQLNLNLLGSAVDQALGAPEQPDMVVALPEQILAWQAQVVDLAPYAAQPGFGLNLEEIPGAFLEQPGADGVLHSLPAARSARFLFYNASFARDLGFEAAPDTAEAFRKQACAANAFWKKDDDLTNDGFGGLALDVVSNWQTPYAWLVAGGGQVFVDGEFHFDSPENVATLDFLSELRKDGCAWQPSSDTDEEHLVSRRALFITGSLSDLVAQRRAFSVAGSTDRWTLLAFPGKQPTIVAYGPDFAVLKSSKERQLAAWLFMRWMLEAPNQARWARETGLFPVTSVALGDLSADGAANPQWGAALGLVSEAVSPPQTAHWRLANKILADGFMAYQKNYPSSTLDGVLKLMDATIKDLTK